MTIFLSAITLALCLPNALFGWLFAAVQRLLWGEKLTWHGPVLVVTLKTGSWPLRTWYKNWGGTCVGYGIMIAPGNEGVLPHELEHTEQIQAGTIAGLLGGAIVAAAGAPVAGALLWLFQPALNYLCASLVALLKRKHGYRDNLFERAARDATKV